MDTADFKFIIFSGNSREVYVFVLHCMLSEVACRPLSILTWKKENLLD